MANPGNYTTANQTAKWSSSNGALASVSPEGTITTHPENSSGFESVVITGTYEDGSVAEVLVYSGGGGSDGGGGSGVSTCVVGEDIDACDELPRNESDNKQIPAGEKIVYHFRVNSGDVIQGYLLTGQSVGVTKVKYVGISETPGDSRFETGKDSKCFYRTKKDTFHSLSIPLLVV